MQSTLFFDEALLRLKRQIGTLEDQQVADLLGLKKAAFSARKSRGSFPEKELRALAQQRPELGIDVEYVLHGREWDMPPKKAGAVLRGERLRINWSDADMASYLGCPLADYVAVEDGQRGLTPAEQDGIRNHDELNAGLILDGLSATRPLWELDATEQRLMQLYRTPGPWRAAFDAMLLAHASSSGSK